MELIKRTISNDVGFPQNASKIIYVSGTRVVINLETLTVNTLPIAVCFQKQYTFCFSFLFAVSEQ